MHQPQGHFKKTNCTAKFETSDRNKIPNLVGITKALSSDVHKSGLRVFGVD